MEGHVSRSEYANLDSGKFKCFVRYLIQVAKEKRCVTYRELENLFGLNHDLVGTYAGAIGDYCINRNLPPLNALIISSSDCKPSGGYSWYHEHWGKPWGEVVSACWKHFHTGAQSFDDFAGRDNDVQAFLERVQG